MRGAGDESGGDRGAEDAETEHGQRSQHDRQRMVDGRFGAGARAELGEEAVADADDDREHQNLDAGGDDVAEHFFGEEGRLVPERERHQDKAGQCRQLELQQGDEELHGQHEEADDDDEPGEEQHGDRVDVGEDGGEAGEVADLLENGAASVHANGGELAGAQEIVLRQAGTGCLQAEPGEGFEDDAGERVEIVDDVGEGADIEHLLDELGEDLVMAGAKGPEQAGKRDVDGDQRGREIGDLAAEQAEAAVDILRERVGEAVDDREVVHAGSLRACGWSRG